VIRTIADAIEAGKQQVKVEEFQQPEAEEAAEDALAVEEAAAVEQEPAVEQLSQGESAEETIAAEQPQEEVPAE
jgi:hypothetical protein